MNRIRIIEILETYRPGENLEADPEVREALELAARDSELERIRDQIQEFDQVFGEKLRSVSVPETLYEDILAAAAKEPAPVAEARQPRGTVIKWFHPAAFAAAAAIIILLALSFTFWNRPGVSNPATGQTMTAGMGPLMDLARSLYENRNPSFKSREGAEIVNYLQSRNALIPAGLPQGFSWDRTFACDVIDVNGAQVSMICFIGPDMKNTMHLFTFRRADFPEAHPPEAPALFESDGNHCATWANRREILVLYSKGSRENLRKLLDI